MSSASRPTLVLTWADRVHMSDGLPFRTLTIVNDGDGTARELSVSVEYQASGWWAGQVHLEPGGERHTQIPLASDVRWACAFFDWVWVSNGVLVTPHVTISWKQGPSDEPVAVRLLAPTTPDPIPDDIRAAGVSIPLPPAMFVAGKF